MSTAGLVHALPRRIEDALWLAEAALTSRAFSTVLLEVHGNPKKFGLTESRRLSLKARATGGRLLILRQAGEEEASSAFLRLSVEPAPAAARHLADGSLLSGSIGSPVFRITPEKSRIPGSPELILEWNSDDRRLHLFEQFQPSGLGSPHSVALFPKASDRPHRQAALGSLLAFAPRLDRAS
jgi:protein ImuA